MEKSVKKWRSSEFLIGIVFFLTVIFFIVWGYNALFDWAQNKNDAPVDEVVVHGDFTYIEKSQLEAQVRKKLDGSFFTLNVEKLQREIKENPWIYGVSIRKEWPQRVKVYAVEQQAFAVWNNDLLLNNFGDVFYANGVRVDSALPRLYGPEGKERDVLQGYVNMQSLLDLHGYKISELVLSERYAWQIWLASGIQLNLGRADNMTRVQRFIDLYPLLQEYGDKKVAKIDLRYDIGLAVSWQ